MDEDLYNEYRRYVFAVCYSLTRNRFDADDLTQMVFLVVMRKKPRNNNRKEMQSWLYRVARFEYLKLRAVEKRYTSIEGMEFAIEYQERDLENIDTGRFKKRTVGFISTIAQRLTTQFA